MDPKLFTSMYSRAVSAMVLAFMVALVVMSSMPSAKAYTGTAERYLYFSENWVGISDSCPDMDSDTDMNYRQRYPWTQFCGDLGPYTGAHGCLMCLQVTNPARTDGVSVTVRIVDICFNYRGPVLYLDKSAFDQIDTTPADDANANPKRQLEVSYDLVECDD